MRRGLAILGTLGTLGFLVWLAARPEPAGERPPGVREPPVPIPAATLVTPGPGSTPGPTPDDPDATSLAPEEEKWLRELLDGYRDPEWWRNLHTIASFTKSPIADKGEAIERRILNLLRTLSPDEPRLLAVFRLVAHIAAFAESHPEFVRSIHDLAGSEDRGLRWRGLSAAVEGFELRPSVLHAAMREADAGLRLLAVRAVGASSVEADWVLTEMATALTDPNRDIRLAALRSLEQRGERTAELYPYALSALESTDAEIRKGAVNALTKMPSKREKTGDALVRAVGDEDRGVAHEALWAVAMFGFGNRVSIELLLRDSEPVLTIPAVMCLGQKDPVPASALPYLLRTIREGGNLTRDHALPVLRKTRRAWEPAFETLVWCMGCAYIPTKTAAVDLLSDFGPRAIPVLEKFRNDRDVGVRVRKTLARLKGTSDGK